MARPYRPQDWRREAAGRPEQRGSRPRRDAVPPTPRPSLTDRHPKLSAERGRYRGEAPKRCVASSRRRTGPAAGTARGRPGRRCIHNCWRMGRPRRLTRASARPPLLVRNTASREPAAETRWVPRCRADSAVGGSQWLRIGDAARRLTVCCVNSTAQKRHPWRRAQDPRSGTLGSLSAAQRNEAPWKHAGASQVKRCASSNHADARLVAS